MNKKNKILIISGDLLKHKYVAIKILKKFKNSTIIFEKYPKNIFTNYSKDKSKVLVDHFKKVLFYEKKYFEKFCKKNSDFLKKKTLFNLKKGSLNSQSVLLKIRENKPDFIILNATSLIKKKMINSFKNKIINIHAGLIPYYRGAGCNVWTFYNRELEYTGVTIHFINNKIDDGKILNQSQSIFKKDDNTHTIGCKNAKLSVQLVIDTIEYLKKRPDYKGKKITSKKSKVFYKKDFTKNVIIKVKKLIGDGLVKNFISTKKKINLIQLKNNKV